MVEASDGPCLCLYALGTREQRWGRVSGNVFTEVYRDMRILQSGEWGGHSEEFPRRWVCEVRITVVGAARHM